MISGRDISGLASMVRKDELSLDIYDVKVWPPGGEGITLLAPVEIMLKERRLCCRIRVFESSAIPEPLVPLLGKANMKADVLGLDACYRIEGTTANGTAIEMENVWPCSAQNYIMGVGTTHQFDFNRLNLPARGADTQNLAQILEELRGMQPEGAAVPTTVETKNPAMDEFMAVIPGVELLIDPLATESKLSHPYHGDSKSWKLCCFLGEVFGGAFCLEAKDGDLWIFYRREIPDGEPTNPPVRQIFSGILDAVGFMHACCPWPYFLEHRQDHRVIERWLDAYKDCNRGGLPPMSKERMRVGSKAQRLFCQAAEFFSMESEEASLFKRSLWLMREACRKSMPFEIRLITLCSVIEGLIHHFENVLLTAGEKTLTRREKWRTITGRLGLPWEGTFGVAYERWNFFRHPLAHGFQERQGATSQITFQAYSRITAAIYLLMASRMGYKGAMDSSVMEDGPIISIGTS